MPGTFSGKLHHLFGSQSDKDRCQGEHMAPYIAVLIAGRSHLRESRGKKSFLLNQDRLEGKTAAQYSFPYIIRSSNSMILQIQSPEWNLSEKYLHVKY